MVLRNMLLKYVLLCYLAMLTYLELTDSDFALSGQKVTKQEVSTQKDLFTSDLLRVLAWAGILMLIYFVGDNMYVFAYDIMAVQERLQVEENDPENVQEGALIFVLRLFTENIMLAYWVSYVLLVLGMTVHWFGIGLDSVDLFYWFVPVFIVGTNDRNRALYFDALRPNFVHRSVWSIFRFIILFLVFVILSGLKQYVDGNL